MRWYFALGDAEYHLNNFVTAESAYQKVIQMEPDNHDIWLEYSHLLMVDNRADEALSLINNGLVFHPNDAELLYRLACYHYNTNHVNEAYQVLEAALDKNPDLCHSIFEYAPVMENDSNVLHLIDIYKNRI